MFPLSVLALSCLLFRDLPLLTFVEKITILSGSPAGTRLRFQPGPRERSVRRLHTLSGPLALSELPSLHRRLRLHPLALATRQMPASRGEHMRREVWTPRCP